MLGDLHGDPARAFALAKAENIYKGDIVVILGDVGANLYVDIGKPWFDRQFKDALSTIPAHFLLIHGNHERRPGSIPSYHEEHWMGGLCLVEDRWPKLHFAVDGEIFDLCGKSCLAVGGAYSIDKAFRLEHGYPWYSDEQPSEETKRRVEEQVRQNNISVILSHTCPFRHIPWERVSTRDCVDNADYSTERWFDHMEALLPNYAAWYCGHWHTDKHVGKMHFLYKLWEELL